jgi:hypothetical protein
MSDQRPKTGQSPPGPGRSELAPLIRTRVWVDFEPGTHVTGKWRSIFGGTALTDDGKEQGKELHEKIGQLTMERDFLEGALGKFPGLIGRR